jgi:hypothetical protein
MGYRRVIAIVFWMVLSFGRLTAAQELTCPIIVQTALQAADDSCTEIGRNQVCYGNVRLQAELQPEASELTFQQAGDIVDVGIVKSLSLSSMNIGIGEWGVALMRVQANLPDTLPGQNVTFLLFGDVVIENAVPTNVEEPTPAPTATPTLIEVSASNSVNVRGEPSRDGAVVGSLAPGEIGMVDGRNDAGDWLHIVFEDGSGGWIFAEIVTVNGDVSLLPVIEAEVADSVLDTVDDALPEQSFGPMQAFYFRTGGGDAPCAEAPDSGILIQTPQGAGKVDLLANEVAISLGSTVYLQAQASGDMIVNVVEGQATVTAFGTTVVAPAGTRVRIPLDADLAASGVPVGPEPYDAAGLVALPVSLLPDVITVAVPLPASEATSEVTTGTPQDAALISGEWNVDQVGTTPECHTGPFTQPLNISTADGGNTVLISYFEGDAPTPYTRVSLGVYESVQEDYKETIQIFAPDHFTLEIINGILNCTWNRDYTLITATGGDPPLPNPGRYTTGGEFISDCPNAPNGPLLEENALVLLDEAGTFEFTYFPALLDANEPAGSYFMPPITITGVPDPERDDVNIPTIENGAYVIERSTAAPGTTVTHRYEIRVISDERIEGITSFDNGSCSITLNYFLNFLEPLSG